MKTIAGIHSGYADNLVLRAADVTIKEQRPLVLAARETPLSAIHLRNLQELAMIPNVRIIPPMMTFYHMPESIEEMTYHIAKTIRTIWDRSKKNIEDGADCRKRGFYENIIIWIIKY